MKNDYLIGSTKISIPPTVLFSVVSVVPDVRKCITMDAKHPGDWVYVLGETFEELGGSEYFALQGFIGNRVPKVNAQKAKALYEALSRAMDEGLVASCHDCSDGGLGVALAETAFAGDWGMELDLRECIAPGVQRNDFLLFSETQSRFVVTVRPEKRIAFEECFRGRPVARVGKITDGPLFQVIGLNGKTVIHAHIRELKAAWQKPLKW